MAHNIETFAYAGETPWHGLGVEVSNDLSTDDMMKAAGLDWDVVPVPLAAQYNGVSLTTNHSALVRSSDSKVLDVITDDWHPMQNKDAFDFFHDFVEAGDMEMHTAGSLQGGKIVFALAKVKEEFEILGGDRVESFLLFTNPHTYGKSIDVRFTPVRVVCNNTLTMALGRKTDLAMKVSHRNAFDARQVKEVLGLASSKLSAYKDAAEILSASRYTQDGVEEYLKTVFPVAKGEDLSRPAKTVLGLMDTQPGAEFGEGSWWQVFNATTFAIDHVLGHNDNTRLTSAWYGANRNRKVTAMSTALRLAA